MPATRLAHLTCVELITLIIFDEEYKLGNSAFPKSPYSALATSVYKLTITLSSNTVSEKPDASDFRAEERSSIVLRNVNIVTRKYAVSEAIKPESLLLK